MASIKETTTLLNRVIRKSDEGGRKAIDFGDKSFRELRQVVKNKPDWNAALVDHLLQEAEKSDCIKRLLALSLLDYFFHRAHAWRSRVVDNLQEVLIIFCELDILHRPLPEPKSEARDLKVDAIKKIKVWHEKFSEGYERLKNVPHFLANSKSMDYQSASASLQIECQQLEEEKRKEEEKTAKAVQQVMAKFQMMHADIERCLKEVSSAVNLLVPNFAEDFEGEAFAVDCLPLTSDGRLHGYADAHSISINLKEALPRVKLSKENEALVSAVRDGRSMLDFYRKNIARWLTRMASVGAKQEDCAPLLNINNRIEEERLRINDLRIPEKPSRDDDSSDEASDFEDVPEKEVEEFVAPLDDSVPLVILDRIRKMEDGQGSSQMDMPQTSKMTVEEPLVPTVPYGLDLKYWGEEPPADIEVPKNNADCHRFWRPPDEGDTSKEQSSVYTTRVITFIGKAVVPTMACKARLSSGKLCPRMDVERCPIHGKIVPRDDEGFPFQESPDIIVPNPEAEDDAEFVRDVEMATGRDLGGGSVQKKPGGRTKKRQRDVPASKQTRDRLEKKLLDKRTVARISAHLDAVRKAKIEQKFAHQFNHALSRR
ncbi:unnamed protein product, partial [Mesorhabditis spiculigera]